MKNILIFMCFMMSFCLANHRFVVLDPASIEIIYMLNAGQSIIGMQANNIEALIEQNPSLKATQAFKENSIILYENVYRLLRISPTIPKHMRAFKKALQR